MFAHTFSNCCLCLPNVWSNEPTHDPDVTVQQGCHAYPLHPSQSNFSPCPAARQPNRHHCKAPDITPDIDMDSEDNRSVNKSNLNMPVIEDVTLYTVCLSSNDHPEIRELISQLLVFKTACFKVSWSTLVIKELHATFGSGIPP